MNWVDTTSYSRGDTKREPKIWELNLGNRIVLKVHRYVGIDGTWFVTAYLNGSELLSMIDLHTDDAEKAKVMGVVKFRGALVAYKSVIDTAVSALNESMKE